MRTVTWVKMLAAGGIVSMGGPVLIYFVTPTEEELFKRYNPELQRRSLERRQEKQEEFDRYVTKLKEYSKSDKHIWQVWEDDLAKKRAEGVTAELERRKAAEAGAEGKAAEAGAEGKAAEAGAERKAAEAEAEARAMEQRQSVR